MNKPTRKMSLLLIGLLLLTTTLWACSRATETAAPAAAESTAVVEEAAPADAPAVAESAAVTETTVAESAAMTETTAAETGEDAAGDTAAAARTFVIDQSQSEASFTLDEELMGSPKTVVGVTSLVSGEIVIDPANPAATTIGQIQIDASDFTTDSDRRNGAIRRFVLGTENEANRYITFTPTAIEGLPETVAVGDSFTVQISGDLTISGVTKPVTFATEITVTAENQISGVAAAQVLRSDFNLTIPSVPSVANVTDEVQLALTFVAISG
jgi:polyisoprenoid-binding protein YceI